MPGGRFQLVLHTHMPYVLSHGKSPHGADWLFEAAAECYLPLLDTLNRLRREGISPRWTVNMTPILAEQLDDPSFVQGFKDYCEEKIQYAISDAADFGKEGQNAMQGLAGFWQRHYTRCLVQFKHEWNESICQAFRGLQEDGLIELITCGATHGYFPLAATEESIYAQVRLAIESHTRRFGSAPKGIWLPECAYRPTGAWRSPTEPDGEEWPRRGVEYFLRDQGIEYFFVDSHMIRGGQPLGTYAGKFPQLAELFARSRQLFTPPEEERSEYEAYATPGGPAIFARDPETTVKVWSGDAGYPGDEHYLEFHKQLYPGRLRYWRISQNKADLGTKQPYDPWMAFEKIGMHARDLAGLIADTLDRHQARTGEPGVLTAMYDTELFGHWWFEGPEFLYELAKAMHEDGRLRLCSASETLAESPPTRMIPLPEGSWGEGGYHSVWLNEDNHWMWEQLHPAQARMRELASRRWPAEAKAVLTQAGRELLLAEASDWPFLISTRSARDYAEVRFPDHIKRFNDLADIAERMAEGKRATLDEQAFIEECREKDACFPHLDPSIWSPESLAQSMKA